MAIPVIISKMSRERSLMMLSSFVNFTVQCNDAIFMYI